MAAAAAGRGLVTGSVQRHDAHAWVPTARMPRLQSGVCLPEQGSFFCLFVCLFVCVFVLFLVLFIGKWRLNINIR